jgi:hypothetical protein
MTKIIEINECGQCPYLTAGLYCGKGYLTKLEPDVNNYRTTEHELPSWCPLEDKIIIKE